ncbi:hypothetical protein EJ04DRAFT_573807 [Polyplosphaeria fusca]|uniref:Uncharacterized protein n=1 Tax=Polyplosphaeria fusca TaxID=682080 RepID=A0A9P4R7H0_9PLEO|nr:hypothetical protein EJ04DRAFT_573807 [Polyplosphaeria fusca]
MADSPGDAEPTHLESDEVQKCGACNRELVQTLSDGSQSLVQSGKKACIACSAFETLWNDLTTAEANFKQHELRKRGPLPRQTALCNLNEVRRQYANFMIELEEVYKDSSDESEDQATELQGEKREHPDSKVSAESTTKRRMTGSRVWFDKPLTIKEVTGYRSSGEYHREAVVYERGTYAAAEGVEYLDTSGWLQTSARFYKQKSIGKKTYISTSDDEDEDEDVDMNSGQIEGVLSTEPTTAEVVGQQKTTRERLEEAHPQEDPPQFIPSTPSMSSSDEDEQPDKPRQDSSVPTSDGIISDILIRPFPRSSHHM